MISLSFRRAEEKSKKAFVVGVHPLITVYLDWVTQAVFLVFALAFSAPH